MPSSSNHFSLNSTSFTCILSQRKGLKSSRYGFNGQEKDNEISGVGDGNDYTALYWEYDPRIGRRFNLDPVVFSDFSQYVCFLNNPIKYNDPLGNTIDVGTNDKSKEDIKSIVKSSNRNFIKIDEKTGNLKVDFAGKSKEEVQKLLDDDKGLALLKKLDDSEKKFKFQSVDKIDAINNDGQPSIAFMGLDHGVINASNNGKDSEGKNTHTSASGYDGEVIIAESGKWMEQSSNGTEIEKSRASIVFHELTENYERTNNGVNYFGNKQHPFGAHSLAIKAENQWHGKSNTPGEITDFVHPDKGMSRYQLAKKYFAPTFVPGQK